MERSLIMLKPDAFERDLIGVIEKMVLERNLSIVKRKDIFLNRWNLLELWPRIHTLWGWLASQQHHVGRKIQVWEIKGEDAVSKISELKISLRVTYCNSSNSSDPVEKMRTLIHTPDSTEDFEREKEILFTLPSRLEECNDSDRCTHEIP